MQFCEYEYCLGEAVDGRWCRFHLDAPPAPAHVDELGFERVELKVGDKMTIANTYKRRTFWQWLTNQPRQLQLFEVKETT